jgi:predicted dehydrogenase
MGERPLRVGVVSLAHVHAPSLIRAFQSHPQAHVVAIAHDDLSQAQQLADQLQVPRVYLSAETMLDKEPLDAVLCCAPNAQHHEVVELATAKGLPVFVEKPMAASVEQGRRMLAAAQKGGTLLSQLSQHLESCLAHRQAIAGRGRNRSTRLFPLAGRASRSVGAFAA